MVKKPENKLLRRTHDFVFSKIHNKNLIYNTCWEDPLIDRKLFDLKKDSSIVMITSAGCNALDYLLDDPAVIHCVDLNSRQNALLELKKTVFKQGSHRDLFQLFGVGRHDTVKDELYPILRDGLPEYAQKYWDKKIYYFSKPKVRKSFYFHGTAGKIAWLVTKLMRSKPKLKQEINALLEAKSLDEQREIFTKVEKGVWNVFNEKLIKHPLTMAMLGVPRPQIKLITDCHPKGILGFVQDKLRHVCTELPIEDNYFWRVYWHGSYTKKCCPNYLKKTNFKFIKKNIDKIRTHTCSLTDFLKGNPGSYSHFVLLDHQDWLAAHAPDALEEEWKVLLDNSSKGTKILMRSAGISIDFLPEFAKEKLSFDPERDRVLHLEDRVGTYGCMIFAEVK